jgi:hypothetical protein
MDDLVKQLRSAKEGSDPWDAWHLVIKAADRIEQIKELYLEYVDLSEERAARIKALEAALRYYADEENWRGKFIYEQPGVIRHEGGFIRGDRGKIARAALGEKKDD